MAEREGGNKIVSVLENGGEHWFYMTFSFKMEGTQNNFFLKKKCGMSKSILLKLNNVPGSV